MVQQPGKLPRLLMVLIPSSVRLHVDTPLCAGKDKGTGWHIPCSARLAQHAKANNVTFREFNIFQFY